MLTAPGLTSPDPTATDVTLTDPAVTLTDPVGTDLDPADLVDELTAGDAGDEVSLPCWTADPDLWFAELPADVEAAKALCVPCPLREACLAGALERREPWGVWGGQLLVGGVVVARKRPRGRPRKVDVAA